MKQIGSLPAIGPQLFGFLIGQKTTGEQPQAMELLDSLAVFDICLFPLDVLGVSLSQSAIAKRSSLNTPYSRTSPSDCPVAAQCERLPTSIPAACGLTTCIEITSCYMVF